MTRQTGTLLSFGHGFSARALSRRLVAQGWRVIGTTRSPEKAEALRQEGVEPLIWPGSDMAAALTAATHVLVSTAPGADGDPVIAALGDALAAEAGHISWLGYLSTTAVYGDHGGGWVDEDTPLAPTTARGVLRARAEGEWQALAAASGLALAIFRLAGIYGPGRGPFAKVRRGTARRIIKPGQVFSRIHVDDIAQVLMASMAQPEPGAVYNVCDDEAAPPEEVLEYAARLIGAELPPAEDFATAEMTPMARSFYGESKRVRNDRMKARLGARLIYPTYRDGLAALLATEKQKEQQKE